MRAIPRTFSFADQAFTVYETVRTPVASPPYVSWGPLTALAAFTGRYTDNRLTVIPIGLAGSPFVDARLASLVFFTQNPQQDAVTGNILIGYVDETLSPPAWSWRVSSSSGLGGSVVQATPSVTVMVTVSPPLIDASISYLLEPVYNKRGMWSYAFTGTRPQWQDSYSVDDCVSCVVSASPPQSENYVCTVPMRNRGLWTLGKSYLPNDIVAVSPTLYYISLANMAESPVSPMQDNVNWEPLSPRRPTPSAGRLSPPHGLCTQAAWTFPRWA